MNPNYRRILTAALALFLLGAVSATRADNYIVTSTNPSGPGSLAQAILDSNGHTGQDTIVFNIAGSGVHLIDLSQSSLPEITDSVIVDGYTQPGAKPNTLSVGNNAVILIQLDGGLVKRNGRGLVISGSNCLVRGLSLTGFQYDPSSDPFFFRVLGGFGIQLRGAGTGNVIQGNFIGLKPDGLTPTANYTGVRVEAGQSIIGGNDPAARNVISGNNSGIEIQYPSAVIVGNYIGTDATGMRAVGNGDGILVAASDVVVGGTSAGAGNLISGNAAGIHLGYEVAYHLLGHADRALVQGNTIGTAADRVAPLGNGGSGVSIAISSNSTVGGLDPGAGNVIAFNGDGVGVGGTGNRILSNSIYSNTGRGITFYSAYSNNGQSFPVITSQSTSPRAFTVIQGMLQSAPNTEYLLQFFNDSQNFLYAKQTYLGSQTVTTDDSGNAAFRANFAVSDAIPVFNATATDPNGNTSEFFRHMANLQNLSARAAVGTGDNALIGGLLVKYGQIVVRGIGPSLSSVGVPHALADPTLEFQDQFGTKMFNDNWRDDQTQADFIQQSGVPPTNDAESAIAPFGVANTPFRFTSAFAPYTAIVRGRADTTGIGVVEVYGFTDPNHGVFPTLGNISARGLVGTDDDVIIGGFILGDGNESPRIVIRAIGPSLKSAGVTNPLSDPVLELHDSDGVLIGSNDDWTGDAPKIDALKFVGLAPTDARESAIFTRLAPGAYTAVVRGKNNATGVALVEVYRLP
ncbi:MAG: large repetitive protein [Verrucomicrobiota bacterium]